MISITYIMQQCVAAATVGMGCGTCCSPTISLFLSTYIVAHSKSMKKAVQIFLHFFLGKLLAIDIFCFIASGLGESYLTKEGWIGGLHITVLVQIGFILLAICLIGKWVYQKREQFPFLTHLFPKRKNIKENKCGKCGKKCKKGQLEEELESWPPFLVGVCYGASPCVPLLVIIGYAVTLPWMASVLVGSIFAIVSSISPILLLLTFFAGFLSKKMYEEIPKWIDYVQLTCYILFLIMGIVTLIKN